MHLTEEEIKRTSVDELEDEKSRVWENLNDSTLPYYNRLEEELTDR